MDFKTVKNELSDKIAPFDSQVKISDEPLPKGNLIHIFIGKKGSGKSTLMLNLLSRKTSPYYRWFDNIFIVSPTCSKDPKFDKLVKELDGEGKVYNELTDDVASEIMMRLDEFNKEFYENQQSSDSEEELDENQLDVEYRRKLNQPGGRQGKAGPKKKKEKKILRDPNNLLILDDCLANLPASSARSKINELFISSRHYKVSIWVSLQKFNKMNTTLRNQVDLLTIFPTDNASEFRTISDDWNIDKDLLKKLYDFATDEKNSFLHISLFGNKKNYFKKFDKIII